MMNYVGKMYGLMPSSCSKFL